MTVPNIKVKVVRKPSLKVKVLPRFPSSVTAIDPILLNRSGGNYAFSLNMNALPASLATFFLPASGIDASSVISGTFAPARLPNPTATTLGGVKSKTNVAHQWLNSIGTNGLPTSTQPDGLDVTYTQTGTGAVAYTVAAKIGQAFSVKDFGAVGDGATNDAVNINKAIVALVAAGGGELYFPRGTYNCNGTTIIGDLSALASRFQGRVVIRGEGVASTIQQAISGAPGLKFIASTSNSEAYFELRNIRLLGAASAAAAVTGSKGLEVDVCAFAQIRGVVAEGFEYGIDCTDVEQLEISNCEFRFNKNGGVFRGVGSVTDTNSVLVTNTQFTNNSLTGVTVNHPNCWVMNGGSVQYNGLVGGASNTGGAFFQEGGTGYGTIVHLGVAFEGNGGIGDFDSLQTTNPGIYSFIGCGFMRTQTFGPTVGYGTNNFNARGTNANTIYRFSGCTFRNAGGYTVSAARPTIALANTSCKIADDGTNYFQSATETLTYPVGQIAAPVFGNVTVGGTLDVTSDFRVNTNKLIITGSNGNAAFVGLIFAAQGIVGGALPASTMTVASTSNGGPSADKLSLLSTTVQIGGIVGLPRVNIGVNISPDTLLTVNGNTGASVAPGTGTPQIHTIAGDALLGGITTDTFGAQGIFIHRYAGGTQAAKTAAAATTTVFSFFGAAWDGSAYFNTSGMDMLTINAQTGSDHSSRIRFRTIASGSTALSERATFQQGFSIGSTNDPGVGAILLNPQTFASLPAASAALKGAQATVSDSTTTVWGATITGGGANPVLAFCNGTNWTVAGK